MVKAGAARVGAVSGGAASVEAMTQRESREVERILLHVSDARTRAHHAAEKIEREGGAEDVVGALRSAEQELAQLHRTLSQATYYAIPSETPPSAV